MPVVGKEWSTSSETLAAGMMAKRMTIVEEEMRRWVRWVRWRRETWVRRRARARAEYTQHN